MFFLYNEIDIESVKIDKGMQNILPESINKISAIYTVLQPK